MAHEIPILHLVVVGFHHKKGYQVDYSYPPLFADKPNDSVECPAGWKYLPTLALPDGSHNFAEDTVFFNLPSLIDPHATIYGVSCYRQIPVEKLKIRTADVTRSTVQKAVCALASRPLYGYIEVKLSLIAQAFFDQGDFSNTDIIRTAFDHLNACLSESLNETPMLKQIHVGLSIRDIVLRWRHKILILFKLMLLQKRVICFGSPVRPTCSLILSILSLHPNLLELGFAQAACVRTSRPMSPMPEFHQDDNDDKIDCDIIDAIVEDDEDVTNERKVSVCLPETCNLSAADNKETKTNSDISGESSLLPLCSIDPNAWGAPLPLFTSGTLCLPYLSLPYMDLLTDPSVNGFIIGTSNILFRQKRQLMDVFIDIEMNTIEAQDADLRRQISLTTEDLRFIDFIVRNVQFPKEDAEGSEQWIRQQFQGYMLAILRTAVVATDGSKDIEHFNSSFMGAWKKTEGYQSWISDAKADAFNFEQISSGHPFAGTLSVGDMKLKIAQTMNSEGARKLNQAVNSTSKAVGGALSQAKGAFSNLWSAFTAPTLTATVAASPNAIQQLLEQDTFPTELDRRNKDVNRSRVNESNLDVRSKHLENNNPNYKEDEKFIDFDAGQSESTLKEEKDTGCTTKDGIVEIGREANIYDSNRQNEKIFTV